MCKYTTYAFTSCAFTRGKHVRIHTHICVLLAVAFVRVRQDNMQLETLFRKHDQTSVDLLAAMENKNDAALACDAGDNMI